MVTAGKRSETREGLRAVPAFGAVSVVGWSLAALFGVALLWTLRSSGAPQAVARFDVTPHSPQGFATGVPGIVMDVSEDGQDLVYVGNDPREGMGTQLYWRSLDTLESRPIPGTAGAHNPRLSPDAHSVAYWASSGLKTVPLAGGSVVTVVPEGGVGSPYIEWAPDGMLYFSQAAEGVGTLTAFRRPGVRPSPWQHITQSLLGAAPIDRCYVLNQVPASRLRRTRTAGCTRVQSSRDSRSGPRGRILPAWPTPTRPNG